MKQKVYKTTCMLGVLLVLTVASHAGAVHAQSKGKVAVKIPFDFTAAGAELPAGEYSVAAISQNMMVFRGVEDGAKPILVHASRDITASPKEEQAKERLVFHRYGNRYFLAQVWMFRTVGRELNQSNAEGRLAKELKLANGRTKPHRIEIAASR